MRPRVNDAGSGHTPEFAARGKATNGKIREVDTRPDGTIEEVE